MSEFPACIKISASDDITDRLRDIAAWLTLGRRPDEIGLLCQEAADEIERLRGEARGGRKTSKQSK
jgi:hypothetical protein